MEWWHLPQLSHLCAHSGPEESSSSKRAAGINHDFSTLETEREFHPVTTASPVNVPHHQPFFKSLLLHEHLLTRDFQGYQHFFQGDGSVGSTAPGSSPDSGGPVTQLVPHEDAPAYSDVATTATAAATSPLTTFSPTTPRVRVTFPQKKSSHDWTRGEEKVSPTTGSLTTQVPMNAGGPARSRIPFPAEAPSSVRLDVGEAKQTGAKTKPIQADPLHNPPSTLREHGTVTASTTALTSTAATAIETAGERVFAVFHWFCRTSKCLCHSNSLPPPPPTPLPPPPSCQSS